MPDILSPTGLILKTRPELLAELEQAFRDIYGNDINLSPSTPDGQLIGILVQSNVDIRELIREVYSSMSPDNAIGVTLDQRVTFNGIQRQAGTFTVTPVTIVTSQAVNFAGLDQDIEAPYAVQDNEGNRWFLVSSQSVSGPGTYVFSFRAEFPGAVQTLLNTINIPGTILLGVTSVNNPSTYTTLGINEESDQSLKARRRISVSLASQGFYSGLKAALLNINGVTSAEVYENKTGQDPDANGVPSHSIWVIVAGNADAADIARAIYTKRNAGAGMKGDQTFVVTQDDGSFFVVRWDYVEPEPLFIQMSLTSLNGVTPPNTAAILAQLPLVFTPPVYGQVNVNQLATFVQQIDPNALLVSGGFAASNVGPFTSTLRPTTLKNQFVVSSPNIDITVV